MDDIFLINVFFNAILLEQNALILKKSATLSKLATTLSLHIYSYRQGWIYTWPGPLTMTSQIRAPLSATKNPPISLV